MCNKFKSQRLRCVVSEYAHLLRRVLLLYAKLELDAEQLRNGGAALGRRAEQTTALIGWTATEADIIVAKLLGETQDSLGRALVALESAAEEIGCYSDDL